MLNSNVLILVHFLDQLLTNFPLPSLFFGQSQIVEVFVRLVINSRHRSGLNDKLEFKYKIDNTSLQIPFCLSPFFGNMSLRFNFM